MELKLHTRGKSEDGGAQAKVLLDAAAAAADTVVLGTLTKVGCTGRRPCQCQCQSLLHRICAMLSSAALVTVLSPAR